MPRNSVPSRTCCCGALAQTRSAGLLRTHVPRSLKGSCRTEAVMQDIVIARLISIVHAVRSRCGVRRRHTRSQIRTPVPRYAREAPRDITAQERTLRRAVLTLFAGFALCACALPGGARTSAAGGDAHMTRARRVLASTPLVDGHNDLPWAIREYAAAPRNVAAYDLRKTTPGHTDIARLRRGMVGAQFWSVYVPFRGVAEGAARTQLEQIDIARQVIARYPDVFALALTSGDVRRLFRAGRIASMIGMEGGHVLENSIGALRAYYG